MADGGIEFDEKMNEIIEYQQNKLEPYNEIRASSIGYCPRQMLVSKLGLKTIPRPNLAQMFIGRGIHKALQIEEYYGDESVDFEGEVSGVFERDGRETVITGHYDLMDESGVIYEWKTTNGLQYVEEEPKDHHVDQMQAYLNLADTERGELVYIQRWIDKDDEDEPMPVIQHSIERDRDYFEDVLVEKAHDVREMSEEYGPILKETNIIQEGVLPEPCDSFFCRVETLDDRVLPKGDK